MTYRTIDTERKYCTAKCLLSMQIQNIMINTWCSKFTNIVISSREFPMFFTSANLKPLYLKRNTPVISISLNFQMTIILEEMLQLNVK